LHGCTALSVAIASQCKTLCTVGGLSGFIKNRMMGKLKIEQAAVVTHDIGNMVGYSTT
jgi:hypothetical protein